MSEIVEFLNRRIAETKAKVQEANERVQKALADRDTWGADLQGYERALAAEMREEGLTVPSKPESSEPVSGNTNGDGAIEVPLTKAEFARRFIRSRADSGATPTDIFEGFQKAGIPVKKPYIYALVQRLQGQTAIRLKRGKWYPVPDSERDSSTETVN
jgi:hypothetical protein